MTKGRPRAIISSMKKVFLFCAAIFAGALAFGQSSWMHSAGLAVSTPYLSFNTKDDGAKNIFAPQLLARYYGERSNGFCVQGTFGAGCAATGDFALGNDSAFVGGFSMGLSLGAGWAFHPFDKWTLAALGSLSLDWERFKLKKQVSERIPHSFSYYTSEWKETDNLLAFGIGAELLASYKFSDRISFFASCALRFFDAGTLWREGRNRGMNYDNSSEIRGNVSVTPSFGAAWTF